MITDFRSYTNSGLRHITYNGTDSLSDLGILITTDTTNTDTLEAKSMTDEIAYRQGNIDSSRINGRLYYKPRSLIYKFKVFGDNRQDLEEKKRAVFEWLDSAGDYRISDSNYDGWDFVECVLKSVQTQYGEHSSADAEYDYITAEFKAYPYMLEAGGVSERVYNFTKLGTAELYIANNAFIFEPTSVITPQTIVDNTVIIEIPEEIGSGVKGFHINGIPETAEVVSATVTKSGQSAGTINMVTNSTGSCYIAVSGVTIEIAYSETISTNAMLTGPVRKNYNISEPKTYTFVAYTEGTPTVKINGTAISTLSKFTIPNEAAVEITNTGYGYYELWHDTTERRL